MRDALAADLAATGSVEVLTLGDRQADSLARRMRQLSKPAARRADATLIIAPEFDEILATRHRWAAAAGARVLGSFAAQSSNWPPTNSAPPNIWPAMGCRCRRPAPGRRPAAAARFCLSGRSQAGRWSRLAGGSLDRRSGRSGRDAAGRARLAVGAILPGHGRQRRVSVRPASGPRCLPACRQLLAASGSRRRHHLPIAADNCLCRRALDRGSAVGPGRSWQRSAAAHPMALSAGWGSIWCWATTPPVPTTW